MSAHAPAAPATPHAQHPGPAHGHAHAHPNYVKVWAILVGLLVVSIAGPMVGIRWITLTLHVGPGTFLPVKVADPRDHPMHAEWGVVSAETAERIAAARREGGRIIAVGTTSLRLLETAAAENGEVRPFAGDTRLFVMPGYRFRAIDLLLTNFHLPRSTLLMLVAALAGLERIKSAYSHAIARGYRFFSYGDACLIERPHAEV